MPSGSTTSNQVSATNPVLSGMFTQLFGTGGAAQSGIKSLTGFATGGNVANLNDALTRGFQQQTSSGAAQIKEAFGSGGMGSSSTLGKTLGKYYNNASSTLTSQLASADLTASGQSLSAASYLSQLFSSSANQYYTSAEQTTKNPGFLDVFSALFPGGL